MKRRMKKVISVSICIMCIALSFVGCSRSFNKEEYILAVNNYLAEITNEERIINLSTLSTNGEIKYLPRVIRDNLENWKKEYESDLKNISVPSELDELKGSMDILYELINELYILADKAWEYCSNNPGNFDDSDRLIVNDDSYMQLITDYNNLILNIYSEFQNVITKLNQLS